MAQEFLTRWNPARVLMNQDSSSGQPYMYQNPRNAGPVKPKPLIPGTQTPTSPAQAQPAGLPPNVLGSEAVRATGSGPFDAAFRQNLATYAGGQFQRPGGYLGFNPTGGLFGNPTGGGNAPVLGMPNDLMSLALGGQSFQYSAPQPPTKNIRKARPDWMDWLDRGRGYGRYFG